MHNYFGFSLTGLLEKPLVCRKSLQIENTFKRQIRFVYFLFNLFASIIKQLKYHSSLLEQGPRLPYFKIMHLLWYVLLILISVSLFVVLKMKRKLSLMVTIIWLSSSYSYIAVILFYSQSSWYPWQLLQQDNMFWEIVCLTLQIDLEGKMAKQYTSYIFIIDSDAM